MPDFPLLSYSSSAVSSFGGQIIFERVNGFKSALKTTQMRLSNYSAVGTSPGRSWSIHTSAKSDAVPVSDLVVQETDSAATELTPMEMWTS
jgi:hypothetical protein